MQAPCLACNIVIVLQNLSKKYKKFINDIVNDNPFKADLFTDQLKIKILAEAKNDIAITFQQTEKMGESILEKIVNR